MIFSLVSSAQEWLNVRWDEHKREIENLELEKKRVHEEVERVSLIIKYVDLFVLYKTHSV